MQLHTELARPVTVCLSLFTLTGHVAVLQAWQAASVSDAYYRSCPFLSDITFRPVFAAM